MDENYIYVLGDKMVSLNSKEQEEVFRVFNENFFEVLDKEKLIEFLENNGATYIASKEDVIDQWADLMCVNFSLEFLDQDYIIRNDDDWEELSPLRYINTFKLFAEGDEITNELRLKEIIKYDDE